jgi:hypothetical protein
LNAKIFIPAVVISDLVTHYQTKISDAIRSTEKALAELDRYLYSGIPPKLSIEVGQLKLQYKDWLLKRLTDLAICILGYPDIKHEDIVKRVSQKRRPFKDQDKGYKDTLIWESVLALASSARNRIILVPNDKDFAQDGELHSDLLDDMKALSLPPDRVKLISNLEGAIDYLGKVLDLRSILEDEQKAEWASVTRAELVKLVSLRQVLEEQKDQIERELMLYTGWLEAPADIEAVYLPNIGTLRGLDIEATYVGDNVWKLDGSAIAETEVEYSVISHEAILTSHSQPISLSIMFTIYFDYKRKKVDDVIIRSIASKTSTV